MSERIHNCIVVGEGPTDSTAALQMARDGLDVVFLERGNRPGEKNVMIGVLIKDKLCELVPDFVDRAPLQRLINSGYRNHYLTADAVLSLPTLCDYSHGSSRPPYFTGFKYCGS